MKPSELIPNISIRHALELLNIDVSIVSDPNELSIFLKLLKTNDIDLFLVDEKICGIPKAEVSPLALESLRKKGDPECFKLYDWFDHHSHGTKIRIQYEGVKSFAEGMATPDSLLCLQDDNTYLLSFQEYFFNDEEFYYWSPDLRIVSCLVRLDKVHVMREAIHRLKSTLDSGSGVTPDDIPGSADSSGKMEYKLYVNEKRELVFKSWLVATANAQNPGGNFTVFDLHSCHEILGAPTAPEMWDALAAIDRILFNGNGDDFQKIMGKLVSLRSGRPSKLKK